jgi:hypothetical protein
MRNRLTHFEQVSMKVVEVILRQAATPAEMPEESPALERQAVAVIRKQEGRTRSNGSYQEQEND